MHRRPFAGLAKCTLKKEGGNFEKQPWGGPSLHSHRIAFFAPLSRQSINYRVTVSRFGVSLPAPASPSLPSSQSSIETPRPGKAPCSSHFPPWPGRCYWRLQPDSTSNGKLFCPKLQRVFSDSLVIVCSGMYMRPRTLRTFVCIYYTYVESKFCEGRQLRERGNILPPVCCLSVVNLEQKL
ncbi:hypothetical protein E2I00_012804, partial [Balaenoptera physalus]